MAGGGRIFTGSSSRSSPCTVAPREPLTSNTFSRCKPSACRSAVPSTPSIFISRGCARMRPSGSSESSLVISNGRSTPLCMMPLRTTVPPSTRPRMFRSGEPLYAKTNSLSSAARSGPVRSTVPLVTRMRNEPGSSRNGTVAARFAMTWPRRSRTCITCSSSICRFTSRIAIQSVLSAAVGEGLSDSDSVGADVAFDAPPLSSSAAQPPANSDDTTRRDLMIIDEASIWPYSSSFDELGCRVARLHEDCELLCLFQWDQRPRYLADAPCIWFHLDAHAAGRRRDGRRSAGIARCGARGAARR